ncbi:MAG: tyrosine--tRNA ligase [Elusimicrobia bacterium]|nr:tyrosine--tRNA ligase [Elusimicrobiota bacterium]
MKKNIEEQLNIIARGSEEFIGKEELKAKLSAGKKLRVKFGADPTAPDLHLGHTVVMEKLHQFQDLGHQIVFIIGDFTAMIGDPSGRTSERPVLSKEAIAESVKGYREQIFRILDEDKTELVTNSSWLEALGTEGLIRIASNYTVAQMLERDDFSKRYQAGNPISITEFIYPLLQGYDSLEVEADIEIGGTDQKFNLLVGRDFQRAAGKSPQAILTMPLLEGTDGVKKMSKSVGNHIGISEPPREIFGKIMSLSDSMMYRYYSLLTLENMKEVQALHPMEAKKRLGELIIEKYNPREEAVKAREEFERVFSNKELPDEFPSFKLEAPMKIVDILFESGIASSKGEAKRLIKQGGVRVGDARISDINASISPGDMQVIRAGKRNFLQVE